MMPRPPVLAAAAALLDDDFGAAPGAVEPGVIALFRKLTPLLVGGVGGDQDGAFSDEHVAVPLLAPDAPGHLERVAA
ncbi:hypothetical protein PG991_007238 [Apiospora marii]|uniref:Uncharacterized protein n=1 Tax=Apiospora marii TaxID=335849 RepID=A0ABR1RUZ4_9PEZI